MCGSNYGKSECVVVLVSCLVWFYHRHYYDWSGLLNELNKDHIWWDFVAASELEDLWKK